MKALEQDSKEPWPLWKIVIGLMGSGAAGSVGTLIAITTSQAVQESRIERNANDIQRLEQRIDAATTAMNNTTLMLTQAIARLEAMRR